jgi:hypothetical protein
MGLSLMSYSQKKNKNLTPISVIEEISKNDISQFKNWHIFRRAYYQLFCEYSSNDSLLFRCVVTIYRKKGMFVQETDPAWDHGQFLFDDKFEKSTEKYPFKSEDLKRILQLMMDLKIETICYYKGNNESIFFSCDKFSAEYYFDKNFVMQDKTKNYTKYKENWYIFEYQ